MLLMLYILMEIKKNSIYITHDELLQGGKLIFRMKKGKIEIQDSLFKKI